MAGGAQGAPLVGVLALQGDFEAHSRILGTLGASSREVRVPADLEGLDALVLPGGESTVMTLGIEREGLGEPLRDLARSGTPVLGTCAGMIMLDRAHLGVLDIEARRNAFGRQLHSFEADLESTGCPAAACMRCSSARRGSPSSDRTSRCSPRSTAIRSPFARATSSRSRSIPS